MFSAPSLIELKPFRHVPGQPQGLSLRNDFKTSAWNSKKEQQAFQPVALVLLCQYFPDRVLDIILCEKQLQICRV